MTRKTLWAVLAIGLALVIAPFALGLPGKSAAGQRMLNGFQPIMQPDQVRLTASYYDNVFVPLGNVVRAMPPLLQSLPATQRQALQQYAPTFAQVPAGLTHYQPLVRTMQGNVDNFEQVNSLPDFRLFTVFFVVPGALLVLLAGYGLFGQALAGRISVHHHLRPTVA
jgi:hypothetical protein